MNHIIHVFIQYVHSYVKAARPHSPTYLVGAADEREAVPGVLAVRQVNHSAHRRQAHQVHVLVQLALAAATLQGPRLPAATCNVRCRSLVGLLVTAGQWTLMVPSRPVLTAAGVV